MKKTYESIQIIITSIDTADIIRTSDQNIDDLDFEIFV